MVDHRIDKALRVVAIGTILAGRHVGSRFVDTDHVVVTGRAGMQIEIALCMIEHPGGEGSGSMTGDAILGRRQVSLRWRWLASGIDPIMTGITAHAGHGRIEVIHEGLRELRGGMTGTTILFGRQVRG